MSTHSQRGRRDPDDVCLFEGKGGIHADARQRGNGRSHVRLPDQPGVKAEIVVASPETVDQIWLDAVPYIERALSRSLGELTTQDLFQICKSGHGALLIFVDEQWEIIGAAVTQVLNHPDGRSILRILAYGADDWAATAHCLKMVEDAARQRGVHAIHFNGRMGWLKRCAPMGYKPVQIVMEKAL
jgi:hypothetical protein